MDTYEHVASGREAVPGQIVAVDVDNIISWWEPFHYGFLCGILFTLIVGLVLWFGVVN